MLTRSLAKIESPRLVELESSSRRKILQNQKTAMKLWMKLPNLSSRAKLWTIFTNTFLSLFLLDIFVMRAVSAREAVDAEKKSGVALPTSGKCAIPAPELKLTKTNSLETSFRLARETCNVGEKFHQQLFLTWKVLVQRISRVI